MEEKRDFKGIWIPSEIYLRDDLSANEIIMLAEINSLDFGEGCESGNDHFSRRLKIQERMVQKILKSLKDKGLIEITHDKKKEERRIFVNNYDTWRTKVREPANYSSQAGELYFASTSCKNSISLKKENIKRKKEPAQKPSHFPKNVEDEFENEFWKEYKRYNSQGKAKAKARFVAQRKKHALGVITQAFQNYITFNNLRYSSYDYVMMAQRFLNKENEFLEWIDGSDNHESIKNLSNASKMKREFISKSERIERDVSDNESMIIDVFKDLSHLAENRLGVEDE